MAVILMENIRSAENVGSIFRTADACATEKILLVGCTPRPIDRMGRKNGRLAKASLGAENTVPWEGYETTEEALARCENRTVIAVEQTKMAVPYTEMCAEKNPVYIFGNEVGRHRKRNAETGGKTDTHTHVRQKRISECRGLRGNHPLPRPVPADKKMKNQERPFRSASSRRYGDTRETDTVLISDTPVFITRYRRVALKNDSLTEPIIFSSVLPTVRA